MTNAQIILMEQVRLMEQGILSGTGQFITVENADGSKAQLELPEPIHTFQTWKELGYSVKKGEHAITKLTIWKHTVKHTEDGEGQDQSRMFMKTAAFFKQSQVELIKKEVVSNA